MNVQQLVSKDDLVILIKTVRNNISVPLHELLDENFTLEELAILVEGFVKDKNWVMALPVMTILTFCQFAIETQQVAQRN